MPNIDMLRARLDQIEAERRTIHTTAGEAELDDAQMARWAELDADEAETRAAVEEAEVVAQRAAAVAESRKRWGSVQVAPVTRTDGFADVDRLVRYGTEDEILERAVNVLGEVKYRGLHIPSESRDALIEIMERVEGAAEHALIHGSPAYMDAFKQWLRSKGNPVYTAEEAAAVRASLSLTSANGGYTLPTLLDPTLIKTGALTKNPIRAISRVVTGTQNVWHGVTAGNVTTAWKSEGAAFTDGSPTFGEASVTAHALTAYVTASYEIFQDSSLASQLPGLISEAIDQAEGVAFVSGSGSGAPNGIITAVSGTAGSLVTCTTRGSFTSASIVDTLAVLNAIPTRYEDSSTWVMNKRTYQTIEQQMVGTGAVKVIEMQARGELLQSPLRRSSSITSTTTSGNILAVYGDFKQFIVYDRIGVQMEYIENVVDGDGLPVGKRGLAAIKRVGSDTTNLDAFRLLKA